MEVSSFRITKHKFLSVTRKVSIDKKKFAVFIFQNNSLNSKAVRR